MHDDATAAAYKAATADARHRQASHLPPAGAPAVSQSPAPAAASVDAQLAAQVRDKQISTLQADIMRLGKELQQPPIGMGGQVVPHLADRQRSLQAGIEAAQREINRLAALDGEALADWAVTSGMVRFTQSGNAVF
jgi:hypothetical protein